VHAARALGLADRGVLRPGQRADFVHWPIRRPAELCYWLGGLPPKRVFVGGLPVV
jgi:imidazolonepropionase